MVVVDQLPAQLAGRTWTLTKHRLMGFCVVLVVLANLVVLVRPPLGPVGPLLVLLALFLVPGTLALAAAGAEPGEPFRQLFYIVLLSLLTCTVTGLAVNWLLPLVGVEEPLRPDRMLPALDLVIVVLGLLAWRPLDFLHWDLPAPGLRPSTLLPLLLPVLAAMGATSLNNGGTAVFTFVMLVGVLVVFGVLLSRIHAFTTGQIVLSLYCVSASLLLMTSLRGWGIVGHDIQIEYHVFQLTHENWHWDIAVFKDPYNACMSLTVLPTVLAGLSGIADPYIYKLVFQLLFALVPVVVFLIVRRLAGDWVAVLGVLFFVAFPTYFTNMPMLNRQEIAFLFFAGMVLLLVEDEMPHVLRLVAFAAFAVGVVLSHYSTTYSLLIVLGSASLTRALLERRWFAALLRPLFGLLRRRVPPFLGVRTAIPLVALPMVIGIGATAYTWGSVITGTSASASATLSQALSQISGDSSTSVKSTDTNASLVAAGSLTPEQVVRDYVAHSEQMRADEDPATLYPASSYDPSTIRASPDGTVRPTLLGRALTSAGVDLYAVNGGLRNGYARAMQVLLFVGILAMVFARRRDVRLRGEIYAMVIASFVFLVALVLVPVLSVAYGLMRAFQQGLIVLALPTALGAVTIFRALFTQRVASVLAGVLGGLFFAVSVGIVAEVTGGYNGSLHLDNTGPYYDSFFVRPPEQAAVDWMKANVPRTIGVQEGMESDRHGYSRLRQWDDIEGLDTLYPGLVRREDYVYLGYSNLARQEALTLFNNDAITFTLPVSFFDINKDLIYNDRSARVYR